MRVGIDTHSTSSPQTGRVRKCWGAPTVVGDTYTLVCCGVQSALQGATHVSVSPFLSCHTLHITFTNPLPSFLPMHEPRAHVVVVRAPKRDLCGPVPRNADSRKPPIILTRRSNITRISSTPPAVLSVLCLLQVNFGFSAHERVAPISHDGHVGQYAGQCGRA